jgi:hypothetical protein
LVARLKEELFVKHFPVILNPGYTKRVINSRWQGEGSKNYNIYL